MIDSEDVDDKDDDGAGKFVVSEAIKSASVKCNELYGDIPVFLKEFNAVCIVAALTNAWVNNCTIW